MEQIAMPMAATSRSAPLILRSTRPSRLAQDWGDAVRRANPIILYNNLALAELGLGATDTAASLSAKTLQSDPMDPAFLMTAGFIADRAGKTGPVRP